MKTENRKQTPQNVNVVLTTITPVFAQEMLKRNIGNRPLNHLHVERLASEMTNGRWKFNGDTICVNGTQIIDGQHRLHAVIKSGVTIESLVVDGLPFHVFDTKDVGERRTAANTLAVNGETDTKRMAAALVMIDKYYANRAGGKGRYSNTEIQELLSRYPQVRTSIKNPRGPRGLIPSSVLDSCHYIFARIDHEMAEQFVQSVLFGVSLPAGSPWYLLRERLVNNSMAKAKLKPSYVMALCIKAWNHARNGTRVRFLKYVQDGVTPEEFPTAN
jgi:hypothetical protein